VKVVALHQQVKKRCQKQPTPRLQNFLSEESSCIAQDHFKQKLSQEIDNGTKSLTTCPKEDGRIISSALIEYMTAFV
jgi:hypothetical protein